MLNKTNKTNKAKNEYCGINKKDFPKWNGWKIIEYYKSKGMNIDNIPEINIHVENFYYLEYLKNKFY